MEIKVGDYVRTKEGKIRKITDKYQFNKYGEFYFKIEEKSKTSNGTEYSMDVINIKDIVKHSPNIIELIEEGDYVNGREVEDIIKTDKKHILYCTGDYVSGGIQKNEIKSIVTKEQFSSLEYII